MTELRQADDGIAEARQEAAAAAETYGLELTVIVPVFNNGEHLRTRAFPSLAEHPLFHMMHVLLVDDGSTYQHTVEAVTELAKAHRNVTAYCHATGGSGAAGRPRNTGIALASTKFLTFLDPDDEFSRTGPTELLKSLRDYPEIPLGIGNQQRVYRDRTDDVDNVKHYAWYHIGGEVYRAGADVLAQAKFRPTNLSSLLLRTSWLHQQGLQQVAGAAGQDSLFFLQAFTAAPFFAAGSEQTYIYYAETPGSMVNTVTAEYFAKCLIRERAQCEWLSSRGMLRQYVRTGLEPALVWYLKRLRGVEWADREEANQQFRQIVAVYVDSARHHWRYPELMAYFRRPGVPSVEGMKPVAGEARRAARRGARRGATELKRAAQRLRGQ